jgi:uncharacterized membrane protein
MKKTEFINQLEQELKDLPEIDRKDILADFAEHFNVGSEAGQSEAAISEKLGNPTKIGREVRTEYLVEKAATDKSAKNMLRATYAFIGLSFFNLIFVSGLFLGAIGLLFGLFAGSLGMIFGGVTGFISVILSPFIITIELGTSPWAALFISIGITAFGLMFFIINLVISRYFYKFMIKYLRLNLNIIRNQHDTK